MEECKESRLFSVVSKRQWHKLKHRRLPLEVLQFSNDLQLLNLAGEYSLILLKQWGLNASYLMYVIDVIYRIDIKLCDCMKYTDKLGFVACIR